MLKLKFKHQKFQADAAKAVVDVFQGQPYLTPSYLIDRGISDYQAGILDDDDFTGWSNQKLLPQLTDGIILENIRIVQRNHLIEPSKKLEGRYNLTIEMETGERVIIVMGAINVFKSRVSGTLAKYNSCIA